MSKAQILIVEDISVTALDIKNRLSEFGYTVCGIASSGEEAVKKAAELKPDLVLMDIVLRGEMNGIQAADKIRKELDVPVIYLTAHTDNGTVERARLTEPFGYIVKPFETKEVISILEIALYKHKIEKELRESEEKFRSITSAANDAIIMINEEMKIFYWNEAAERIFGYSKDEALGKIISNLLAPEKVYVSKLEKLKETDQHVVERSVELEGRKKNATKFPAELSLSSVKIKGKWHAICMLKDITERKRAELLRQVRVKLLDKLRGATTIEDCLALGCEAVSDARLFERAVFTTKNERGETTHYGQVGLDSELVEKLSKVPPATNEMFLEIFREEFKISRSYFIPVQAGVDIEQTGRYVLQDSESGEGQDAWQRGDELLVPMMGLYGRVESWLSVDTPYNKKRPDKACAVYLEDIVDITARQIRELMNLAALTESEERYRAFTEEALIGVYIFCHGRYIFVNPAMEKITGYSREELLEVSMKELVLPESYEILMARHEVAKRGEEISREYTLRIRRKDGEVVILQISTRSIMYEGEKVYLGNCIDITERIRAEEALAESEERYRILTEEAMIGIYIYRDGRYLFVNPAMERITGYSRDELLTMNPYEELASTEGRKLLEEREKAVKSRKEIPSEYIIRVRRKDDSIAILEVRSQSIVYGGSRATLGNCVDVTEFILQRQRIEHAKKEWERTFDAISDLVMILASDRTILKANRAVVEYTGLTFKELIGKPCSEVFYREFYWEVKGLEFAEITDPVTGRVFSVSASPVRDKSGKAIATVEVARDITETRKMEEALVDSEVKFRGLAESAKDIIFSFDFDGMIRYLNPAVHEMLDYDPDELIGKSIFDTPLAEVGVREALQREMESAAQFIPLFETEVQDIKGRKRILEVSIRRLSNQLVGIARDVTERRQMEQQLLRASKLASVGVLAAGIAHQVNNPLTIMLSATTMLRDLLTKSEALPQPLMEQTGKYLGMLDNQVERTSKVVAGLLKFTQTKRPDVKPMDVNRLVTETLYLFSESFTSDGFGMEFFPDSDIGEALADPIAVQQVMVNLIQNAVDAAEGKGKLVLKTCSNGDKVRIAVIDNGPGVPLEIQEKIFEPLFSTKSAQKGTGLGLSVSVMLLESFGGQILYEDTPGGGATFIIELPRATEEDV